MTLPSSILPILCWRGRKTLHNPKQSYLWHLQITLTTWWFYSLLRYYLFQCCTIPWDRL